MDRSENIKLKKIDDGSATQLVGILNTDSILQNSLSSQKHKVSKEEFIKYNHEWAKSKNSEIFAIVLDDIAIGMISLSHQDIKKKKAQVGYWISSKYWRKGYTSNAFSQILNYAETKGIKFLNAEIEDDNLGSKKIWEKHGARIELIKNRFHVSIELS